MNTENQVTVNREHKSNVFAMLFKDRKKLLSLYNALNHSNYTDEWALEVVTLENAIYMSMKNDLAFLLDSKLNLYEHQSTPNPNMPLRDLFYVSREYEKMVSQRTLYTSGKVKIPAPHFIVFYNGTKKQPEKQILKLSDLYQIPETSPMLELKVLMLNINEGNNEELKNNCQVLKEYMQYVIKIRNYMEQEKLSLQEAVEFTVTECIKEGILEEFLRENRAEVISMSIFEFDAEREWKLMREAEYQNGVEDGIEEGIKQGKEFGLSALVTTLKKRLPNVEEVYDAVIENEMYKDVTREQVGKYF